MFGMMFFGIARGVRSYKVSAKWWQSTIRYSPYAIRHRIPADYSEPEEAPQAGDILRQLVRGTTSSTLVSAHPYVSAAVARKYNACKLVPTLNARRALNRKYPVVLVIESGISQSEAARLRMRNHLAVTAKGGGLRKHLHVARCRPKHLAQVRLTPLLTVIHSSFLSQRNRSRFRIAFALRPQSTAPCPLLCANIY